MILLITKILRGWRGLSLSLTYVNSSAKSPPTHIDDSFPAVAEAA